MISTTRKWIWMAAVSVAAGLGCNKTTSTPTPALTDAATIAKNLESPPATPSLDQAPTRPAEPQPAEPQPVEQQPVAAEGSSSRTAEEGSNPLVTNVDQLVTGPLEVPVVILSAGHLQTCRRVVGDLMADATVTDIQGTDLPLVRLLGEHLTVMIFWSEQSAASLEQFRRIPIDILADFAADVKVIAINVGGDIAQVRNLTGDAADRIVSLVDREGKLFSQFATGLPPRTYIVDHDGKILWFDIEYSQSTQRSLRDALAYFLKNS